MDLIDLRSDTVTRPTAAMREAMARAEVGDDVYGEDPTVLELERRAAKLLGKEHALFVPSGTMGNQLTLLIHTRPGDADMVIEAARERGVLISSTTPHTLRAVTHLDVSLEQARRAAERLAEAIAGPPGVESRA